MQLILIIVGAFLGAWASEFGEAGFGMIGGAFIGYLIARLAKLQLGEKKLRSEVDELQTRVTKLSAIAADPSRNFSTRTTLADQDKPEVTRKADAIPPQVAARTERAIDQPAMTRASKASSAEPTSHAHDDGASATDSFGNRNDWTAKADQLFSVLRGWLTSGNVPVKLGVIISFFGVAFLLKYAVERQILYVPIELRLVGVAAAALVMLGIGWRLREKKAVYALSLQGGGIGILYLTIFAAFRLYNLLPATMAFILLVALTIATGVLAVKQDAKALAILGIVGGFLAPVLTSTGQGSHVALFTYYLLLNAAILGISWYKPWRSLNLLGWLFTFGIGTLWGYRYYTPALYTSTQPFLVLFFLFYQAIAVLYAFRQPPKLRGLVDGTILFGTPVIAFALQSRLVSDTEYGLAISAAALASFYVLLASWLYARHREQLRLMVESYVALGVAFATIAIPLALDARWTAAAWSLEGAALVWIGVRQSGLLARASGALLLFAGGVAFIEDGWQENVGIALLNGNALGGFLISAASLFGALRLHRDPAPYRGQPFVSLLLLLWGVLWWFTTGGLEIDDRAASDRQLDAFLVFAAASAAALALVAKRLDWRAAAHVTLAYLPLLIPLALIYLVQHSHWLRELGWLAWPAAMAAHFYLLRLYDNGRTEREGLWHLAGTLFFTVGFAGDLWWRLDNAGLAEAWPDSAALALMIVVPWLILSWRERFAWPLQRYSTPYLVAAGLLTLGSMTLLAAIGADKPGDPDPLPYIPLLNPYDIVTAVSLLIALRCLQLLRSSVATMTPARYKLGVGLWLAAAFILTTIAVVRGVHHLANLPWTDGLFSQSVAVQAALSIYWAILGFTGMILGARRAQRSIWMLGAAMMGVVVAKLFLVDLGNTATVARIVSFLGVGILLLVVGYFAPAPPRVRDATAEEAA